MMALQEQALFLRIETGVHTSRIKDFCVTADGSYFVSYGDDKTIRVWDPIARQEVRQILGQIGGGVQGNIQKILLTPDDRYLLVVAREAPEQDVLRIYAFDSGTLLHSFAYHSVISALDFSPNGRYLLIANYDQSKVDVWDFCPLLAQSELLPENRAHSFHFPPNDWPFNLKCFDHEGECRVITAVWNLQTQAHYLALYSLDHKDFIGEKIARPHNPPGSIAVGKAHIAISSTHDPKLTLINRHLDSDSLWEIETISHPNNLKFSPDQKLLLAGYKGEQGVCIVYDADNQFVPLAQLDQYKSTAQATAFLNNHTAITGGGDTNAIHLWQPQTGQVRGIITGKGETKFAVGLRGMQVAFGNIQRRQFNQNNEAPLEKVFHLEEKVVQQLDLAEREDFQRTVVEQNGRQLRILENGTNTNFFVRSDQGLDIPLTGIRRQGKSLWYFAEAFTFTPNNLILAGTRNGEIYCCTPEGNYLAKLQGHQGIIWDLAVQADLLLSCGADQTICLWDLTQIPMPTTQTVANLDVHPADSQVIHPFLRIFIAQDGEWIVWSESGYYDASIYGDQYVGFHLNQGSAKEAQFLPSERFANALYRPDIIREIIKTRSETTALRRLNATRIEPRKILPPTISYSGMQQLITAEKEIDLTVTISSPESHPLQRVWVLGNGQQLWETADLPAGTNNQVTVPKLPLRFRQNELKIFAETTMSRSAPCVIQVTRPFVEMSRGESDGNATQSEQFIKPNLYLLSVGISLYQNHSNLLKNLNFADEDAKDIARLFKTQKNGVFGEVIVEQLTNEAATRENIFQAAHRLETAVHTHSLHKQTKDQLSQDVTIVFLSGHGTAHDNEFYLLTHETDPQNIAGTALPIKQLGNIINKFPTEIVLLTDACRAGLVGGSFNSISFTKQWLAINDRAQIVFNATSASNVSYEGIDFKANGAFTTGILQELAINDQTTILQLFPTVSNRVRQLTYHKRNLPTGIQTPTLTIHGVLNDYPIYQK